MASCHPVLSGLPTPQLLRASHHFIPSGTPTAPAPQGLPTMSYPQGLQPLRPLIACCLPSSHGFSPPCPLRASPSPANLPRSSTALKELQRCQLRRHLGALKNPASHTPAGNKGRFVARRVFVDISKDKFCRGPHSSALCPRALSEAVTLQQKNQRAKGFLATFPTTLHAWATVAEHKHPFSPLPQWPGDTRDQSKSHWLQKDGQKRSSSRFAGTAIHVLLATTAGWPSPALGKHVICGTTTARKPIEQPRNLITSLLGFFLFSFFLQSGFPLQNAQFVSASVHSVGSYSW